jgi:hypothetical protein
MSGKVLFEEGPHQSRTGFRGEITEANWNKLRAAAPPYVPDDALAELANKIMFAEADAKRGDAYVATRHQLAQLKKLKRIAKRDKHGVIDMDRREHCFADLADALANLDQDTLERIKAADLAAIQAIVDRDGVFVDVDGIEHCFVPPTIQVVRPFASQYIVRSDHRACQGVGKLSRTPARVWFPQGIEGFKDAVAFAITELEAQQDGAGRREKPWQGALVRAIVEFWQSHRPNESQSAHRDRTVADGGSLLVEFGRAVFAAAGSRLSATRVSNLLNTHR